MSYQEPTGLAGRQRRERWQRARVLAGALLVMCMLGVVYGFSALTEPLARTFPSWSQQDIQAANTLALLFFALSMVPAGWLQDQYGPRLTPLLAALFFLVGLLGASQATRPDQKMLWWASYGVLNGIGVGLATVSPLAALNKWFPERRGLISGVALMGFGIGAAIFIPTVSNYLDPARGGHSLQQFFQLHALLVAAGVALGGWQLQNPPRLRELARAAHAGVRDRAWGEMLGTPRFWTLWLMMALSCTAGLMTIAVVKAAVKENPLLTAAQASLAGSILALCNALGRPLWGLISDRLGRQRAFVALFALQATAMFLLAPGLAAGAGPAFVLVGLIGLNFGGAFGLFAPATAEAFGTRHLGVNYGFVFTGYGVAGVLGPQVAAYYKDTLGVFGPAFQIGGLLAATASLTALVWTWRTPRAPGAPVVELPDRAEAVELDRAAD
ncbi:MAG: OFA family MFS transporter [Fimbriimonadaceae bacterium]|nr:OFA family MFS transporter [Fimbriimonadaceae bacterium]